jgi:hypothetical protein
LGAALSKVLEKRPLLILGGILLLGLLNGLLFLALMPPWQHYDEPGHFEYAWLMANRGGLPAEGEYDQGMRRELASSMVEHDFFAGLDFKPDLLASSKPIYIGISQSGDLPVYYWLVSLPLRLIRSTDLSFQLYAARLVSLILYLVTILAAYGVMSEITPQNSALRWLVPLTLVLMPGFTDLMTAVNNDVGAVAFFALFLWAAVRMIRHGFTWMRAATCLVLMLLCLGTKTTVLYAALLFPLAVLLSIISRQNQKWIWISLGVIGLVITGLVFSLNSSTGWYLNTLGGDYRREEDTKAVTGQAVMRFQGSSDRWTQIYSPLEIWKVEQLRGKTASLGAWMWADQPVRGRAMLLDDESNMQTDIFDIGTEPQFFCFPANISADSDYVNVRIQSASAQASPSNPLYVDDVILVQGDYCERGIPKLSLTNQSVQWGDEDLENLVENASFEERWIMLRPFMLSSILGEWYASASNTVTSLGDWSSSGWYYQETLKTLVRTFWGKFGWGHIPLVNGKLYWPLALITLLGCIGGVMAVWKRRTQLDLRIIGIFLLALVLGWAMAFGRGIGSLSGQVFIGSARYAYPVMILTLVVLVSGWNELLGYAGQYSQPITKWRYWIFGLGLICLNLCAWWSILDYYSQLT